MPYIIKKMTIDGFRGFREKEEIDFDQGLVILCGPQRSGKSSVLNAPVWALIGPEATKEELGPVLVRERVGWKAENLDAKDCRVEVVLQEMGGGSLTIERMMGRNKYTVKSNGSEMAETPLAALGLTLEALVSSVFLPQEVIRAALSVRPGRRKPIFMQLAGLEELRALEECFKSTSDILKKSVDKIGRHRESIDNAIRAQVKAQRERIGELAKEVHSLGLSDEDTSPDRVRALTQQSLATLTGFCKKYGMALPTLPEVAGPDDLPGFDKKTRLALSEFEATSPETEKQKKLFEKKQDIEGLITEHEGIEKKEKAIINDIKEITNAHGTADVLKGEIEKLKQTLEEVKKEIDLAGNYQKMIEDALSYFETLPEKTIKISCPVCQKPDISVAHVRKHLSSEIEKAGLEPLRQRKKETEKDLNEKKELHKKLILLTEQQDELKNKQATLVQDVCNLRGQPLDSNEAVDQVLSKMKKDVDDKLMELKGLLEKRGEAIHDLRSELDKIRVAGAFHRERERLNKLDEIPNLPEYRALDDIEKKAELRMSFLSELERCIEEEIEQAFSERFAALKHDVNEIYRELVGREDFPEIWIDPAANWEVLAGAGGEGTGVTRVFNVGDMTAVALCLFLASASRASHNAGFILLDDPTQNLDDAHETRLAEILANLAKHRQIIVSSSRVSFIEALRKAGTVKRQLIPLAPWDNNRSCRLEK